MPTMRSIRCSVALALLATTPAPLDAQAAGQAARPAQGRRTPAVVMSLSSPAFVDGGAIPAKHAQPGTEWSPPLAWSGVPDSVASFVLLVHDLDAATGNGTDDMLHWLAWNIPGTARALREGIPQGAEQPDGMRQVSVSGPYYRGPGAPASGPPHHYVFELFALDTRLEVPPVGAAPAATRAAVLAVMAGRVRGKGVLVGTFRRGPS
jgi:Raf kinase inhibitor-like YbhB/YbcL family protein